MNELAGRVAVVTGGGSDIGRGIALGLGSERMTVAVGDIQEAKAAAVAAEIEAMPAEDVGPIVIRAIRANRFLVVRHPHTRSLVDARFRAILEDFDFASRK